MGKLNPVLQSFFVASFECHDTITRLVQTLLLTNLKLPSICLCNTVTILTVKY